MTLNLNASNLTMRLASAGAFEKMIMQHYSYRYYYYYGPLSGWRDGRAMGCRELT